MNGVSQKIQRNFETAVRDLHKRSITLYGGDQKFNRESVFLGGFRAVDRTVELRYMLFYRPPMFFAAPKAR